MKLPDDFKSDIKSRGLVTPKKDNSVDLVQTVLESQKNMLLALESISLVSSETAKSLIVAQQKIEKIKEQRDCSYNISVDRNEDGFISSMIVKPILNNKP
jgi:hypothetical protein